MTNGTFYNDENMQREEYDANQTNYYYASGTYPPGFKAVNKHAFVWIFTFLLGAFGVDRFFRGQFFLGLFKLLTGGLGGIWYMIDFLIAFFKAYLGPFTGESNFVFFFGHWIK